MDRELPEADVDVVVMPYSECFDGAAPTGRLLSGDIDLCSGWSFFQERADYGVIASDTFMYADSIVLIAPADETRRFGPDGETDLGAVTIGSFCNGEANPSCIAEDGYDTSDVTFVDLRDPQTTSQRALQMLVDGALAGASP